MTAGDFAQVYDQHFDRIYAFVARRVRDRHLAEDLTSDVFHRALANLAQFEDRGAPVAAWLFGIARNAVVDHWKKAGREVGKPAGGEASEIPVDEVAIAEESGRLFRHVRRLPSEQRLVITERFVKEKSIRQIAQGLGKSEGAVKQLQSRALATLRKGMGEDHG